MSSAAGCLQSQILAKATGPGVRPTENLILQGVVSRKRSQRQILFGNCVRSPVGKRGFCAKLQLGKKSSPVKSEVKKSSKPVSYGGCIPSVLRALETIQDLDDALKPWEERLNSKERTIILKEQTDWKRALEIFNWFKRKGCYELNVIHYNVMLRILGEAQKWDLVGSLWIEMQSNRIMPTNSTYGTLINAYCKGSLNKEALIWLTDLYKQGMEPDEVTMGVVLQTYKKAGKFQKAEQFFQRWSSDIFDDSETQKCYSLYTYNTLLDTYGKAGQLEKASRTFLQMLREGITPDTVTFNTMIHVYGNNGLSEEVSSLTIMMEEYNCTPDTRTYNILISIYLKINDISTAASYFSKLKLAGLEPDIVSYRTLLYAYSVRNMVKEAEALLVDIEEQSLEIDEYTQSALTRMYISVGMMDKSWSWFEKFSDKMSSECFSANIDAFGEKGHIFLAEKAFACCLSRKKLSVLVFNVMIKAYGIQKDCHKACKLFNDMIGYDILPDKFTYSSLIQMLSVAELPDKAVCYLRKMQEGGLVSDCVPYSAVMTSYAKVGEVEMVEHLFKEMISFKVQPDIVVYSILINAFTEVGNIHEAMKYVDSMKRTGFVLNPIICNSLIKLYTKTGYLIEAQEVYEILKLSEYGPDVYASNCMINLYCENVMLREAEEIFNNLKHSGKANEFSYGIMLCLYKKLGQLDVAYHIAQEMQALGLVTSTVSCNNIIGIYATNGRMKQAVETFSYMLTSGIIPDDATFKTLGLILLKHGVSKEVIKQLESARGENSKVGLYAWIKAICSILSVDVVGKMKSCYNVKSSVLNVFRHQSKELENVEQSLCG
ncbi:pentatricopeptide repeat-containing protein [Canna indica]|uniref:Pentatricopeptide repeat-containing protein n=1 Tax=Canna indica TaxID=4628 RepID=A0AAQ3KRW3_9LILI|nr:pentatricopeptide repeat-containing protein [Canna indica]